MHLSNMTALIEEAAILRDEVKQRESELAEWKARLDEVNQKVLHYMLRDGTLQLKTPVGTLSVRKDTVVSVADWSALDDYIISHKATDLLQRRVSVSAWRERTEAGEVVPGTSAEVVNRLVFRGAGK